MIAIIVFCLVGLTVAQPPRPCVSPLQWEARFFDSDVSQHLTIRGRLSYDADNRRERILQQVDVSHQEDAYDIIALYNERVEYVYDFNTKNCTRRPLTRSWRDFGIPPDSRSFGEAYIGSPDIREGFLFVTLWGGNYTTPNDTIRQLGTWTFSHCLPVNIVRYSERFGRSQTQFINITEGIQNISVFTPRPECLTEDNYSFGEFIFGKSPKFAKL